MSSAFPKVRPVAFRQLLVSIQAALLVASACTDGDAVPLDATTTVDSAVEMQDAGEDIDANEGDPGVEPDAESGIVDPPDAEDGSDGAGTRCLDDEDCDDAVLCNGKEQCVEARCVSGTPVECTREHPCREETQGCDCRKPDSDGDTVPASICVGDDGDCDDGNINVHPGQAERCDLDNVDEDCNPTTFAGSSMDGKLDGDRDHDGWVSDTCMNFDRILKKEYRGPDCDDTHDDVHPRNSEVCNYIDDNCNGAIDELPIEGTERFVEFGLRPKLYPDFDQDGYVDMDATPKRECDFRIPPGYGFPTADDCDDRPLLGTANFPGAPERCDLVDNDCDDRVDEVEGMQPPARFAMTTFACTDGRWTITECPDTKLWCGGDPVQGCQEDGTRLSSCGHCERVCTFACNDDRCDEIAGLAAGEFHACAWTAQGRVACWGRGAIGRLGTDSTNNALLPTLISGPLPRVDEVAAGRDHSCAIAGQDHALYCWGSNAAGQLGSESIPEGAFSATFVPVASGATSFVTGVVRATLAAVQDVDLAMEHTCAVLSSHHLVCWGQQEDGRLGNNRIDRALQPLALPARRSGSFVDNADSVTVGDKHGCILTTAGQVECWGDNTFGQLGRDPAQTPRSGVVVPVQGLSSVSAVFAGAYHTCALSNHQVYCWGENRRLQLGRSLDSDFDFTPRPVAGLSDAVSLDVGRAHGCAITSSGRVACWGANDRGQAGHEGLEDLESPTTTGVGHARSLALNGESSCATSETGTTLCWGDNFYGQLGNGSFQSDPQPLPVGMRPLSGSRQ